MSNVWIRAYVGLAVIGVALEASLPGPAAKSVVYQVVGALGVGTYAVGIMRRRPARPIGWWLGVAGWGAFLVGDILFDVLELILHADADGSVADVFYLAGYPLVMAGIATVVRHRSGRRDMAGALDVATISIGLSMVMFVILNGQIRAMSDPSVEHLLALAYPMGDLCLLASLVRLLVERIRRDPAFWPMAGAMVSLLAADLIWNLTSREVLANCIYMLAYLLVGMAGLVPGDQGGADTRPERLGLTTPRTVGLACALLAGPVLLVSRALARGEAEETVVATAAGLMVLLALVRMGGLIGAVARSQAERGRLLDRNMHTYEVARAQVATQLHDGPIQSLARIGLELERVNRLLDKGDLAKAAAILDRGQLSLRGEIDTLRRMMSALRPPALDEVGIEAALRDWVAQVGRQTRVPCRFDSEPLGRLDSELETTIYRSAQEALDTLVRLAGGDITVSLTGGDHIRLSATAAGRGGNLDRQLDAADLDGGIRLSLMAMRERVELAGGRWAMTSSPAGQVSITAVFRHPALTGRPSGHITAGV
jgi:signal transduction histidine kinase